MRIGAKASPCTVGVEYYDAAGYATDPAPDGRMVVDLANYVYLQGGGIEQTVATVAGQSYDVSFWAGNSAYAGRDGTGIVRISIDGTWLQDIATAQGTSQISTWAQRSFSFTASGSSSTVRFWNDQNPYLHFALIDGVSIDAAPTTAVPEPQSLALLLAGIGALAARRRRHA